MRIQGRTAATVTRGTLLAVVVIAGTGTAALGATPANDDRGAATVVGDLPFTDSLDTTDATPQDIDPDCFGPSPTVWYAFTPGNDMRVIATTRGSDYDTTLALATQGPDGLDIIRCNDDWADLTSLIAWRAQAGTEYLLMVGDLDGEGGDLRFAIRRAPPRPSFALRLARSGTINRHGAAVVRGLLRCDGTRRRHFIEVFGRQDVGRLRMRGFGEGSVRCGAPFRVRVRNSAFRFGPGTLTVRAAMHWCTAVHCGVERAERAVRNR